MRLSNIDLVGGGGWQRDPNLPPPVASQHPSIFSLFLPLALFWVWNIKHFYIIFSSLSRFSLLKHGHLSFVPPPPPLPSSYVPFPSAFSQGWCYSLERLRVTFTPNGRLEFVPRVQVFPLFSVYSLLLLHKISSFMPVLTIGVVRDCFYLLIFCSEKFSTRVWFLPFAVNANHSLSIVATFRRY